MDNPSVFCLAAVVIAATKLRPRTAPEAVALPERGEIKEREALAA